MLEGARKRDEENVFFGFDGNGLYLRKSFGKVLGKMQKNRDIFGKSFDFLKRLVLDKQYYTTYNIARNDILYGIII